MNNFLKKFNIVYLVYFFFLITFPGSGNQNFSNNLICLIIILFFILVVNLSFLFFPNDYLKTTNISVEITPKKIKIFTIISALGLMSFMFDRIFLLGIDYKTSFASVRYQLIEITENTSSKGVKSIFSLMGNILIPFAFWNLILLLKNEYRSINKRFYIIVNSLIVVISSLLFGGRTNILLYLLIIVIFKPKKKKSTSSLKVHLMNSFGVYLLFFLIGYVFFDRVAANDAIAVEYLVNMLHSLRGDLNYDFYTMLQGLNPIWSTLFSVLLMIDAYFVHSFWVFSDILNQDNQGIIFGQNYIAILSKFDLMDPPKDPSTAGLFIGLPGGIYYDYGYLGLCFLFIVIFCLIKFINLCFYSKYPFFNLGFVILTCLQTIFLASPFIIISDIYMFPAFVFTGIIYSYFISKKKYANRSN